MAGEDSERDFIYDFLDSYRVSAGDGTYVMSRSDLGSQFDEIDSYLSGFRGTAKVEIGVPSFLDYHERGFLDENDEVVVYAVPELHEIEESTVTASENTHVILGRSYSESIPVEFRSGVNPFRSYRLHMPTHDAIDQELKLLRGED